MKQFYTLFLLFALHFSFGQTHQEKYDYFVQFNGNQLSKKVKIDEVLNHPFISKLTKDQKTNFDLNQYADLIKLDQKAIIHGNFTDSISFYQVTIPIKNKAAVKDFLLKKYKTDSLAVPVIQDFGSYSVLTPEKKDGIIAWNDSYLVFLSLSKKYHSDMYGSSAPVEDYGTQGISIEGANDTLVMEAPVEAPIVVTEAPVDENQEYDNYTEQQEKADKLLAEEQMKRIKALFENGFTPPVLSKINENADISSWINYASVMSTINSAYDKLAQFGSYSSYLPLQKNLVEFVKGVNLDFYFDNDNARIEEVVEYTDAVAGMVGKITNRKVNSNIFKYFPNSKPISYLSYHMDTKAILENFPTLLTEIFQSRRFKKEDLSIVTDLISTIVDEEAAAKLFDGDLSLFLYNVKEIEVMKKVYEYDENFEEVLTEKKQNKTVPLFSLLFTSTHPTLGDKLIQLGVRKKLLVQKGNYYVIEGTKEYGDIFILKDKDVVVIANTLDYFKESAGSFSKEAKKELKKNYFYAQLNMDEIVKAFGNSGKAKADEMDKINKISGQFSNMTFQSAKKLIDNKLKFELKLNSLKSDKNIILQTLDLAQELTAK